MSETPSPETLARARALAESPIVHRLLALGKPTKGAEIEQQIVLLIAAISQPLQRQITEQDAIIEAVGAALQGQTVSDFMASFSVVRMALDAQQQKSGSRARVEQLEQELAFERLTRPR